MRNQVDMWFTYGLTGMGLRTGHAADSPTHHLRASYRHWGLGLQPLTRLHRGLLFYNVARVFSLCSSRLRGRVLTCEHHSITVEDGKGTTPAWLLATLKARYNGLSSLPIFFFKQWC